MRSKNIFINKMKHMNYLNYYLLPLHPLAPSSCPCPPSNALPSLSHPPSIPPLPPLSCPPLPLMSSLHPSLAPPSHTLPLPLTLALPPMPSPSPCCTQALPVWRNGGVRGGLLGLQWRCWGTWGCVSDKAGLEEAGTYCVQRGMVWC